MDYSREFFEIGLDAAHFKMCGANEWHGPCPFCGGRDRFAIFTDRQYPSWNWFCRAEGTNGWADQINTRLKSEITQQQRDEWSKRAVLLREAVDEKRRLKLAQFSSSELWRELHERMTDANRQWWEDQGIPGYLQDFYRLGFVAQRQFTHDEKTFVRDAYTIPKFGPSWSPKNIDYRIVDPPDGMGKYRPAADLPAAYFLSRPDYSQIPDEITIVEGSKKSIIVCQYLDDTKQVVGVPSKNSWAGADKDFSKCGRVWIMLDPDATDWAERLARAVGSAARIVSLPVKPDDIILAGARDEFFSQMKRYARKDF